MAQIIDSHHHLWRLSDLPWLNGPIVNRIFGPYQPIQRDYLASEFIDEASRNGVEKSVYVQVNWPLERSVDEVAWVQSVADETGWPHAIVGSANMFDDSCPDVFAQQLDIAPLMRGIRLQMHWHENELYRFASGPNEMADPVFRRNLGVLAGLGWHFELQVFGSQMADAERLVRDFPELTFVLLHAGMLEDDDPETVERWRAGMQSLAKHENVIAKLSGLGTFVRRVDDELIGRIVRECIDLFGAERCMWGSNFPVEKLWTDYGTLLRSYQQVLDEYDQQTRDAVFGQTAGRVYRLNDA